MHFLKDNPSMSTKEANNEMTTTRYELRKKHDINRGIGEERHGIRLITKTHTKHHKS